MIETGSIVEPLCCCIEFSTPLVRQRNLILAERLIYDNKRKTLLVNQIHH